MALPLVLPSITIYLGVLFFLMGVVVLKGWLNRNKIHFHSKEPNSQLHKECILKAFKSFIFFPSQKLLHGLKWVKLPLGWSKLNTDGFALQNSGLLGGGGFSKIQMGCGFVVSLEQSESPLGLMLNFGLCGMV